MEKESSEFVNVCNELNIVYPTSSANAIARWVIDARLWGFDFKFYTGANVSSNSSGIVATSYGWFATWPVEMLPKIPGIGN